MIRTIFEQKMLTMVKKKMPLLGVRAGMHRLGGPAQEYVASGPGRTRETLSPRRAWRGRPGWSDGFSWTFRGVAYASHGADSRTPGAGYL